MLSDNVGCSMGLVAVWSHVVGKGQTRKGGTLQTGSGRREPLRWELAGGQRGCTEWHGGHGAGAV